MIPTSLLLPGRKGIADSNAAEARDGTVLSLCTMRDAAASTFDELPYQTSGHLPYTITTKPAMRKLESNWMSVCSRILGAITCK